MAIATMEWNESIARFVIETYSRPFDLVYDCFSEPTPAKYLTQELLRSLEQVPQLVSPFQHMKSMPENMLNLMCFHGQSLLEMEPDSLQNTLRQTLRILSPGGYCCVLISDGKRYGKIVPNGFQLVHRFLANGFKVVSIHDQQTSRNLPFHLTSHQYLAIFQKPDPIRQTVSAIKPLRRISIL